jgi:hypothetical protein
MRFPRMTTRRWMVVVAVVALSFVGEQTRRRAARFRLLAQRHAKIESSLRTIAARLSLMKPSSYRQLCGQMSRVVRMSPELVEYHAALRLKYERAARYPWLAVELDPPEP